MRIHPCSRACAAALSLMLAPLASADLSDVIFRIEASNASGSGSFEATVDDADFENGIWTWSGTGIPIMDGDELVAFVDSANTSIVSDPVISLGFALTAGTSDTSITISSAVLSFPTLDPAMGSASVGTTVTDVDGDASALVTGDGPDGGIYVATYNGATEFAELLSMLEVTEAFDSVSDDAETGSLAIADPVSSMSTSFSFTLSANDAASGTSVFAVVPEPAGVLLLAVAGAFVRRR